jgi:hypothetical protein
LSFHKLSRSIKDIKRGFSWWILKKLHNNFPIPIHLSIGCQKNCILHAESDEKLFNIQANMKMRKYYDEKKLYPHSNITVNLGNDIHSIYIEVNKKTIL